MNPGTLAKINKLISVLNARMPEEKDPFSLVQVGQKKFCLTNGLLRQKGPAYANVILAWLQGFDAGKSAENNEGQGK